MSCQFRRCGLAAGALAALVLAAPLAAEKKRPAYNPLYDIVAVGRAPGKIVLATLAQPASTSRWRFRTITLRPENATAQAVLLSKSGTKALVVFSSGAERVLDLTAKIGSIGAEDSPAASHRLPGQWFPLTRDGKTCLVDDSGQASEATCRAANSAAVHEDGRTLYATADGKLFRARPASGADDPLVYRLPSGARYRLLAGQLGDTRDFLILVEQHGAVQIIDPTGAGSPLGTASSWEVGELRAAAYFRSAGSDFRDGPLSDSALQTLAQNLTQEAQPGKYEWSFFRVKPEVALYSPVLEFASDEPAFPSDFGIWEILNPISKGRTREEYQAAYETLGDERWRRCKVYFRQTSYPGSWLLEYWYYYPFDEGKPHRHIHDSEHVFIEVDKLGGTVRSFIAADHGQFAPNNGYLTTLPRAKPITLPLFALVEFEKHAMCPDINRDGAFTRGVDVNLYEDRFTTWGVRDLGENKEHLMMRYHAWMSLPRRVEDRMAVTNYAAYFPDGAVNADKATCGLLPLPEEPPCKDCETGSPASAQTYLTAHPDAHSPVDIYKPWVAPWHQFRIGWALFDHVGNHRQLYAAYVGEIAHLAGGILPLPGRLSFEVMSSPASGHFVFPLNGQSVLARRRFITYTGVRYERLLTGTQGFYFGITPLFWHATNLSVNGSPVPGNPRWEYKGLWYRGGYIFELPFQRKGNLTHHVGYLIHGKTFRFEWRVSMGLLRHRGRHSFGLREGDPNPYQ